MALIGLVASGRSFIEVCMLLVSQRYTSLIAKASARTRHQPRRDRCSQIFLCEKGGQILVENRVGPASRPIKRRFSESLPASTRPGRASAIRSALSTSLRPTWLWTPHHHQSIVLYASLISKAS